MPTAKVAERRSFEETLRANVKTINHGLKLANKTFQNDENSGRDGMIFALEAAIHFLSQVAVKEKRLLIPLRTLSLGLIELSKGNPPTFLKKTKTFGVRASDPRLATQGAAAGALQALIKKKTLTSIKAADNISNRLKKLGFPDKNGISVTLRALRDWQTEAKSSDPESPMGKAYYYFATHPFETDENLPLEIIVLDVLEHVAKTYRLQGW